MSGGKNDTSKWGTGKGRASARRTLARQAGDIELADSLRPPSEQKLSDAEKCGARNQPGAKFEFCQTRKGSRTDHPGYGNCSRHGGNTTAGVKAAMKEMGRDLAARFKSERRFGGDRRDPDLATLSPEAALLEEVRRSAAFVRFLEERIARWNLSPDVEATVEAYVLSDASHKYFPAPVPTDERGVELPVAERRKRGDNPPLARHLESLLDAIESDMDLPALTESHQATGISSFTDAREWLVLYREERGHLARTAKMCIDAGVATRLVSLAEDQGRILASAIRAVLNALQLTPDQAALVPQVVPPVLRAVAADQPIPDVNALLALPSKSSNNSTSTAQEVEVS